MVDIERLQQKAAYIHEQLSGINNLLQRKSQSEILLDPWLQKGLKYSLQTAVEAMIDMAYHVAVKKFHHAPEDARDAFRVLAEKGVIAPDRLPVYNAMVGFRNRVVHGYQDVTPERVYEIARYELDDFERFLREILAAER